jgi:hypothetical protein
MCGEIKEGRWRRRPEAPGAARDGPTRGGSATTGGGGGGGDRRRPSRIETGRRGGGRVKRKELGDRRPPRIGDLGLPAHPPGGATTVAVQSRVMSSRSSPGVCSPPAGGTLPSPTPLLLVSLFLSVMQVHSCFLSWPTLDFFLLLLLAFLFVDLGYNYYS